MWILEISRLCFGEQLDYFKKRKILVSKSLKADKFYLNMVNLPDFTLDRRKSNKERRRPFSIPSAFMFPVLLY